MAKTEDGDFLVTSSDRAYCFRCGASDLGWGRHRKRWVLREDDGSLHVCSVPRKDIDGS